MDEMEQDTPRKALQQKRNRRMLLIWAASLAIAVLASVFITRMLTWNAAKEKAETEEGYLVYSVREAREILRQNAFYYEEDERALTDATLKGLAAGTGDHYAEYYTEEEYAELQKQNKRTFVGIGILTQLNEEKGVVEIIDVYDNTPAKEQGLQAGDIITEINGVTYSGQSLSEFLNNVRAEDGAENTFGIRRGEESLTFVIVAREVHTPSVSSRMLTGTIGYIHVQTFHGTCVDETKAALEDLRAKGMKSLVLDLRDNLGGSLYDAVDIADIFLPRGYVVTTLRSRNGEETEYKTEENGIDIKTVLLVNEMSASASELVAGAMKDHDAAYLIGTKTYGKGIVQSFYQISETKGWLKITSDAYYTPSGVCVQDEGIEPDLFIELSDEAKQYAIESIPAELDTQLKAAIDYLEE
jgi:carboxyl-terminal processing protease